MSSVSDAISEFWFYSDVVILVCVKNLSDRSTILFSFQLFKTLLGKPPIIEHNLSNHSGADHVLLRGEFSAYMFLCWLVELHCPPHCGIEALRNTE